jgi:DNA-binding MarR family transcriptional regulator
MFISKLARVLERGGLIARDRHPADPRAVQLRVTPRGGEVVEAAAGIVRALQEANLAPLGGSASARSAELRRTLLALLHEGETGETEGG